MTRTLLTLLTIAVIGGFFYLMYRSWQRRIARTADRPELVALPANDKDGLVIDHATYLGTVTGQHWLDRVASHGLGGRGPAAVTATSSGLRIDRVGMDDPVYLSGSTFVEVSLAKGLAGRTFGKDSVVVISWLWVDEIVHTGIRIADPKLREDFRSALAVFSDSQRAAV